MVSISNDASGAAGELDSLVVGSGRHQRQMGVSICMVPQCLEATGYSASCHPESRSAFSTCVASLRTCERARKTPVIASSFSQVTTAIIIVY